MAVLRVSAMCAQDSVSDLKQSTVTIAEVKGIRNRAATWQHDMPRNCKHETLASSNCK